MRVKSIKQRFGERAARNSLGESDDMGWPLCAACGCVPHPQQQFKRAVMVNPYCCNEFDACFYRA